MRVRVLFDGKNQIRNRLCAYATNDDLLGTDNIFRSDYGYESGFTGSCLDDKHFF